jgi:hypothetical protein
VTWEIPFGTMEAMPVMSDTQRAAVLARNRREVSG